MSILIKGMEMPDDCKTCDLCQYDDGFWGFCFANDERIADEGRREDCPLIEVPPHGRLIDADDAFIDADERGFDFWCCDNDIDNAQRFIREQPTVIEAEGGALNPLDKEGEADR